MRVGVLGTGQVGAALGAGFVQLGHEVRMGAREPRNERAAEWARHTGHLATYGTFADSAAFGQLIVIATRGVAVEQALHSAGPERFVGKTVIDATNPLVSVGGGPPTLAFGESDSAGERVQRLLEGAHVVKAFNTAPSLRMYRPRVSGSPPEMLLCGDFPDSNRVVSDLLEQFGWRAVDVGGIRCSRYLESLALLRILCVQKTGRLDLVFRLVSV
ncbi:MAG TPA: NAD(P)-binding domain-containing protein [Polyangiaceae bacterium]|nr:NAD(P)-binding domain-containing protein [Polyangiaceae bacterium]